MTPFLLCKLPSAVSVASRHEPWQFHSMLLFGHGGSLTGPTPRQKKPQILSAVGLVMTACAVLIIDVITSNAFGEVSAAIPENATGIPHIVDMTSQYIELQFRGNVLVQRTDQSCIYRFPSLTVELLPSKDARFSRTAYIQHMRMIAVAPGLPGEKRQLIEEKSPIAIVLEQAGATGEARDVVFRLSKPVAEAAEYVGFNLGGRSRLHVNDDELAANLGRTRDNQVAWPMSARSNILSRWTLPDGSFGGVVRKAPSDSDDWCAPEKIH
jgi:hypothetical protein